MIVHEYQSKYECIITGKTVPHWFNHETNIFLNIVKSIQNIYTVYDVN